MYATQNEKKPEYGTNKRIKAKSLTRYFKRLEVIMEKINCYSKCLTVIFQYDLGVKLQLIPRILNGIQALQNKSRNFRRTFFFLSSQRDFHKADMCKAFPP